MIKYCPLGSKEAEPIGGDWVIVGWDMVDELDMVDEWEIGEGRGNSRERGEGGVGEGEEQGEEERRVRFAI